MVRTRANDSRVPTITSDAEHPVFGSMDDRAVLILDLGYSTHRTNMMDHSLCEKDPRKSGSEALNNTKSKTIMPLWHR